MAAVGRVDWLAFTTTCAASSSPPKRRRFFPDSPSFVARRTSTLIVSVSAPSTPPEADEAVDGDVLQAFYRDRELNGDFVTRVSNTIFWRQATNSSIVESESRPALDEVVDDVSEGGFLKLSATREWLMGDNSAPINKKIALKELQDDRERRKKLNLLMYEALKKELLLLMLGVGAACSVYCLVVFSLQTAVSYAAGVGFSYLYLQLLCQHADVLSRDSVPEIFRKKKTKKIGIRSDDLKDLFERSIRGSGVALSSPRLVIPAAVFGLWVLSHRYSANDFFDFQIVPAMLGMFAYKAAALIQVYRDNEDLKLIFPQDGDQFN